MLSKCLLSQFLQVLEGDTVHFPTPKNQISKDIVLEKDTPFFATSDAPLVLMFQLHRQIRRDEQRNIAPCGRCFAELLLKKYLCIMLGEHTISDISITEYQFCARIFCVSKALM